MRAHIRGHPVYFDGIYRYLDGEPAECWGGEPRPCPKCGELPTPCDLCTYIPEGPNAVGPWMHDPCLGHVEGVKSACCGHGVDAGYMKRR